MPVFYILHVVCLLSLVFLSRVVGEGKGREWLGERRRKEEFSTIFLYRKPRKTQLNERDGM